MSSSGSMSLTDHLTELRKRLLIIVISVGIFFLASYYFSSHLLELIQNPIGEEKLVFLSPTEAFISHINISFYFLVSP